MSATPETSPARSSKIASWSGRILTGLLVLANLMGVAMNLSKNETAVKGAVDMGYPAEALFGIGVALLISTILFAIPKTTVLGGLLLTGYYGGAVATHIRAGQGWDTTVPAFIFAALLWVALLLREPRLRAVLPIRK
jgi:hypothetical protein